MFPPKGRKEKCRLWGGSMGRDNQQRPVVGHRHSLFRVVTHRPRTSQSRIYKVRHTKRVGVGEEGSRADQNSAVSVAQWAQKAKRSKRARTCDAVNRLTVAGRALRNDRCRKSKQCQRPQLTRQLLRMSQRALV